MRHKALIILFLIWDLIFLVALTTYAVEISDPDTLTPYFDRDREGWFWNQIKKSSLKRALPKAETAKAMRERAELLLDRALEEPNTERVKEYLVHQKKLLDRSEEVAQLWKVVLMQHPELDATVGHPLSAVGADLTKAALAQERDRTLLTLAERSGLLYFFSGNCAVCPAQSALLSSFASGYGFKVVPISVDGASDPVFSTVRIDRGVAKRLGVETLPAIFLAQPPDRVVRIGTGLITAEEISDRLILLEKYQKGLISQQESDKREDQKDDADKIN